MEGEKWGVEDGDWMEKRIPWPESHRQPPASQADVFLWHLGNMSQGCGMPVLPWRSLGGGQTCSLLPQYRGRLQMTVQGSADW